jgi:arsenate reductase
MAMRPKVLFLCTGNACRSQMAEAWARRLHGERMQVWSAGVAPAGVDPRAVQVMAERGVDLSGHRSKHVDELSDVEFDLLITVCDRARESCPVFPGAARRVHAGFDDPPHLARGAADEEQALEHYRRVRDEIEAFVRGLDRLLRA